jgi:hypothetical protein
MTNPINEPDNSSLIADLQQEMDEASDAESGLFFEQKSTLLQARLKANWTPEQIEAQRRVREIAERASKLGIVYRLNVLSGRWQAMPTPRSDT